jgi:hypothetical protein
MSDAPTKTPDVALPDPAPTIRKTWVLGSGETEAQEWTGVPADIEAKYQLKKTEAQAGSNISQLETENAQGRARLVVSFGRITEDAEHGNTVTTIEELYAVDILEDISTHNYFTVDAGTKITDDQAAAVIKACDLKLAEAEIILPTVPIAWAAWTAAMKQLRYHLNHGCQSLPEQSFVLRRSLYGVQTSKILVSFTGINTVVTAPSMSSSMNKLVGALPTGEWLYKPPQAEHLGQGKWRITQEWHWRQKWSKLLGGTWGL